VYAYNTAALEILAVARSRKLRTVLEQTIAPRQFEERLLARERETFPDWERPAPISGPTRLLMAREAQEWETADLIVCGSKFVSDGIAACGGPTDRCVVIPYGVDAGFGMATRSRHMGPLRILVVGRVGLRKGSPYVAAAARRLAGRVEVRMVGPLDLPPAASAKLADTVTLTGSVPRSDMRAHFAWADIFLLPSICEGSSTAVYEAMAAALPVICTPNTGAVVRDGIEGIIVAPCDADAIVAAIERLADNPDLRRAMAQDAVRRAREHDLKAFAERLLGILSPAWASGGKAA
jgi:glycosyltransferase involved in cell wall biosynthesis